MNVFFIVLFMKLLLLDAFQNHKSHEMVLIHAEH